jgi:hypothetical protein
MTILNISVPKSGAVYTYDTDKLPEASVEYLLENGAKQSLADSTAGMVKKDWTGTHDEFVAECKKLSDHRDLQIRTGAVPRSGRGIDPEAATAAKYGITVEKLREMLAGPIAREESTTTLIPAADKKKKAA